MSNDEQDYDFDKDRPNRSHMDDPNIKWRSTKPDYTMIDKMYLNERSKKHKDDSLEKLVQNLVKTWEMEATHKPDYKTWKSVDPELFKLVINNGAQFGGETLSKFGSYNLLIQNNPLYDSKSETFESSHTLFRTAFKDGFAWEVLEVFTGPPRVVFSWRHWGHFTGPYRDNPPTGEELTMYGMGVAVVDDKLKFTSINVYYDSNQILAKLEGKTLSSDKQMKNCPFSN